MFYDSLNNATKPLKQNAHFSFFFILQYNKLLLDKTKNKRKIFYKEIPKKETRKYSTSTYLTALSNRAVKKVGRGWTPEGKK